MYTNVHGQHEQSFSPFLRKEMVKPGTNVYFRKRHKQDSNAPLRYDPVLVLNQTNKNNNADHIDYVNISNEEKLLYFKLSCGVGRFIFDLQSDHFPKTSSITSILLYNIYQPTCHTGINSAYPLMTRDEVSPLEQTPMPPSVHQSPCLSST